MDQLEETTFDASAGCAVDETEFEETTTEDEEEEEEDEEEDECHMMASFFSEAQSSASHFQVKESQRRQRDGNLEGCSPLMAASRDYLTEDERVEFFDPFGQMDPIVKQTLLRLAREERAEAIAAENKFSEYVN